MENAFLLFLISYLWLKNGVVTGFITATNQTRKLGQRPKKLVLVNFNRDLR